MTVALVMYQEDLDHRVGLCKDRVSPTTGGSVNTRGRTLLLQSSNCLLAGTWKGSLVTATRGCLWVCSGQTFMLSCPKGKRSSHLGMKLRGGMALLPGACGTLGWELRSPLMGRSAAAHNPLVGCQKLRVCLKILPGLPLLQCVCGRFVSSALGVPRTWGANEGRVALHPRSHVTLGSCKSLLTARLLSLLTGRKPAKMPPGTCPLSCRRSSGVAFSRERLLLSLE